ncbi:hypothetical protein [Bradyrhizobium sp.]|jgi:hypothetical protein|uniref:hypothetical protein n=1 Tax=Bradyrhizobium sp. TaxID=376 RepID=UPI002DF8FF78|nr:hypothetical protein [Bradyrhizobium sp.]
MAAATLKVKNLSTSTLTLKTDDGRGPVDIDAGEEADIGEQLLTSKSFMTALAKGQAGLSKIDAPTNDQLKLARRVLPRLLARPGAAMVESSRSAAGGVVTVTSSRSVHKNAWTGAEKALKTGKDIGPAAKTLVDASDDLLGRTVEKAAVTKAEDDLAAHVAADVPAQDLPAWFTKQKELELALAKAKQALAAAEATDAKSYGADLAALRKASEQLGKIDIAKQIGTKPTDP